MELAFFLPVPFIVVMFYALLVPNGRNAHVGYLGSLAGIVTLVLLWFSRAADPVTWFSAVNTDFFLSVIMDPLSKVFVAVVAGVGVFVFLYSVGYFEKGEDLRRYYVLLSLFAWSMIGAVISGNLFQLFFCWELVGVSSFLLIGFWHHKETAVTAAKKALMTIIVGDAFFLMGVLLLWTHYGTSHILPILQSLKADPITLLAGVGIIGGAISKSAQFPLHGWLADAMAGPTPVSAFLHSATMVKAGLFVIARFLPLLVIAGLAPWLTAIAVLTIVISGAVALVETDIKRVLAYSTMNQLAFILLALSLNAVAIGMYHLVTHSVFKALLFFAAGVAIHVAGTQDLRKMRFRFGWNFLPVTSLIGVLALAGLVPFSGFFSKEGIFEAVLHANSPELIFVFSVAIVMSAAYIFRWYLLMFHKDGANAHGKWQMSLPLPILALLAFAGGASMWTFFKLWGAHAPNLVSITAVVSTALVALGFGAAWYVHTKGAAWLTSSSLAAFCRAGFMMDDVYNFAVRVTQGIAWLLTWIDTNIVDNLIKHIGSFFIGISNVARKIQTGHPATYAAAFVVGFLIIVVTLGVFA